MRRTKALNSNYTKEQLNTLFASIITSFMTTLNSSALNLSIPGIGDTFGVSAQAVGWVITIYTLASVSLSLPFGKLADLTSRVKVMRLGVLTFTAGCVLAIGAGSFTTFILLRLLQGVGAAMIFSTNNAVLMGALPPSQSGRALGSSVCATYIGLSVGPVTGGFLNSIFGWRSVLVMVSIVGLIALFVCLAKLPSDDGSFRGAREFDWQSAVFYGTGLICLMYGISCIGGESLVWIGEVLVGAMLMLVFIKRQLKLRLSRISRAGMQVLSSLPRRLSRRLFLLLREGFRISIRHISFHRLEWDAALWHCSGLYSFMTIHRIYELL